MTPRTPPTRPTPVVSIDEVSRRYGRAPNIVTALDSVSFDLLPGTMTAVVGPSGSGKTTLLHLLAGWDQPDTGEVRRADPDPGWDAVALIPQNLGLLEELTVAENLTLPGRIGGVVAPVAVDVVGAEALAIDHLLARWPHELSMGEQQRVAVLRATQLTPALLIADEPTAHQDEHNTYRVLDQLQAKAGDGAAVVVATHDSRLLAAFDHHLYLEHGAASAVD